MVALLVVGVPWLHPIRLRVSGDVLLLVLVGQLVLALLLALEDPVDHSCLRALVHPVVLEGQMVLALLVLLVLLVVRVLVVVRVVLVVLGGAWLLEPQCPLLWPPL